MKLTKNFLIVLSLIVSLSGMIIIYISSINLEPNQIKISDITSDMEGRKISTTGYIIDRKLNKDGHLFLVISDNKSAIQVPLFSDLMGNLKQIGVTERDFHLNDRISVKGALEIYKDNLQIVPRKPSDVKILGD
ncbi:MAG: hypothetical protein HYW23_03005 [Candidatus Aenigmarchaeota archaeon]|nr:hypothetical protein [Candidatus Aenigmarchaeota archaeon]